MLGRISCLDFTRIVSWALACGREILRTFDMGYITQRRVTSQLHKYMGERLASGYTDGL